MGIGMRSVWIIALFSGCLCKNLEFLDSSRYLPLPEIYAYLNKLAEEAPETVELELIGDTYIKNKTFKNEIYLVKIGDENDPILYFDCGIHAREWIASATCLYLIQKLAISFEDKSKAKFPSIFNYQWHFVPMMNPDGYATTHVPDFGGEDHYRMHRKNMRPWRSIEENLSEENRIHCDDEGDCGGVDINRNFPSGWGLGHKDFVKESKQPWTNVFKGVKSISEPESKAIAKHMEKIKDRTLLAISIHSYGKDIYYPKGWLDKDDPDQIRGKDRERLRDFAKFFNKALGFRIGSVSEILEDWELCGGATDDYYWTSLGINLTYTVELHPHLEEHDVGFKLPSKYIKPVGDRMWKAIQLMAIKLDQMYPFHKKQGNT